MKTGELIKILADYCPDTPVKVATRDGYLRLLDDHEAHTYNEHGEVVLEGTPSMGQRHTSPARGLEGGHCFWWGWRYLYAMETRELFGRVIVAAAEWDDMGRLEDGHLDWRLENARNVTVLVFDPDEEVSYS